MASVSYTHLDVYKRQEVEIAGAVSMYALTLASGCPSALLDWNNNFAEDRSKCVCTHRGNFPKSFVMNELKLGTLGVLGRTLGKVHTFGEIGRAHV